MTHKIGHVSYLMIGGFVEYGGFMWTDVPGIQLSTLYGRKKYSSESQAMNVCKGSTTCTGVNMVAKNVYQLATGSLVKAPGKKVFLQGDETYTASSKCSSVLSHL